MLTLDLPPTVERMIIANASNQGISPETYITSLLPHPPKRSDSFYQAKGMFKDKLEEMLAFQKQLRDEWD